MSQDLGDWINLNLIHFHVLKNSKFGPQQNQVSILNPWENVTIFNRTRRQENILIKCGVCKY